MSRLLEPLPLPCGKVLAGRLAVAPLTNRQSDADGTLSDVERRWLVRRATGGFALVSTCATFVSEEGKAWKGQLGISDDAHIPGLRRLAQELTAPGALAIVQLHHGGIQAALAPGSKLSTADGDGVRGATDADIDRVIADFVAAALRAQTAGFDGVEVHGANGYLFTQFLAPADNPRTDRWGGSLENRARFLRRTVQAVRAAVAPDFAVGVRLSPVDGYAQRGLVLADSVQVGQWLAHDGVDWIHLSLGDASGRPPHEPDAPPVARAFRDGLPDRVPVFAVGGVWTTEDAERALDTGADVVVVGRAAMAHPNLPQVIDQPGWTPTRPPWDADYLRAQDLGQPFIDYISNFPGMVVGGAPPRH